MSNNKNIKKKPAKVQASGRASFEELHQLGAIDEKNERKRWKSQNWKEWIDEDEEDDTKKEPASS